MPKINEAHLTTEPLLNFNNFNNDINQQNIPQNNLIEITPIHLVITTVASAIILALSYNLITNRFSEKTAEFYPSELKRRRMYVQPRGDEIDMEEEGPPFAEMTNENTSPSFLNCTVADLLARLFNASNQCFRPCQ